MIPARPKTLLLTLLRANEAKVKMKPAMQYQESFLWLYMMPLMTQEADSSLPHSAMVTQIKGRSWKTSRRLMQLQLLSLQPPPSSP